MRPRYLLCKGQARIDAVIIIEHFVQRNHGARLSVDTVNAKTPRVLSKCCTRINSCDHTTYVII